MHFIFFPVPDWLHFGILRFLRITSGSAEHTPELNHSRARLICSGILQNPESGGNPEGRTRDLSHNTMVPYYHMVLFCNLPHHSMLPVVPGPLSPLSLPTAGIRRPRHPQPVDAETELQRRIRITEFRVLMYTQLAVIHRQRLRDFDMVPLKNGPHIRKC